MPRPTDPSHCYSLRTYISICPATALVIQFLACKASLFIRLLPAGGDSVRHQDEKRRKGSRRRKRVYINPTVCGPASQDTDTSRDLVRMYVEYHEGRPQNQVKPLRSGSQGELADLIFQIRSPGAAAPPAPPGWLVLSQSICRVASLTPAA